MNPAARLTEYAMKVASDILEHRCHITGVFEGEGDRRQGTPFTPFMYTTGLRDSLGTPELVMTGDLPPNSAGWILNKIVDKLAEGSLELRDGGRVEGIIREGLSLRLDWVATEHPDFPYGIAHAWYGEDNVPAYQVVWPDKTGKYPDEEGYDHELVQPLLARRS